MEKVSAPEVLALFARLEFSVQFYIDLCEIEKRFQAKMIRIHPDQRTFLPQWAKKCVQQEAAQLNEARQALRSPILRGHLVLCYHGAWDEQHPLGTEILMRIFAWQDQLDRLNNASRAWQTIKKEIKLQYGKVINGLGPLFQQEDFPAACRSIHYLLSLKRLIERV